MGGSVLGYGVSQLTTLKTHPRKHPHQSTHHITTRPGEGLVSQVIGTRGLKNLGGRIQEEYDRLLESWSDAIDFYLEMRDDMTISTLMNAIKLPLLAAEFDVEAASDSMVDIAARDWLWDAMNNMDRQSWRSHVQDMLEAPSFGWSLAEIVLQKRKDGRLWIRNLDPRGQETLHKWEFDEFDHTIAFIQKAPYKGQIATIPMEKTIHMTFDGRKGNPQGRGMFRVLFRTWRFLRNLENLEGIGLERSVGGMPVATLPPEPLSPDDLIKLQDALSGMRIDEEGYLIVPDGLVISPYGGSYNTAPLNLVIDRKKKEILMLGFAQFIMLGMNQVGTQALVKGSQDFFTLGLEAIQQMMLESWNGQLVPFLFRYNAHTFPGMTGFPKITWEMPGKVDLEAIINSYNTAVTAKLITPTKQDEEHIRGIGDFPDLPEGVGDQDRLAETGGGSRFSDNGGAGFPGGGFSQSHFALEDPNLRSGGGDYEDTTNALQRRLVNIYDQWAVGTRNQIISAQEQGIQPSGFSSVVEGRLSNLESSLITSLTAAITTAATVALGASLISGIRTPRVAAALILLTTQSSTAVSTGLITRVRDSLNTKLANASTFDRSSLKTMFDANRGPVASLAGFSWTTVFAVLLAAGRDKEDETGQTTRVRWLLNDVADHCEDSAGKFGCPGLAGIYNSWADLKTVPAGETTCRGNCRCRLESESEPGSNVWVRGLPDFNP